jgi:DNA sulfur modification protein DndD
MDQAEEIDQKLAQVPVDDEIKSLYQRVQDTEREHTEAQSEAYRLGEELERETSRLETLDAAIERLHEEISIKEKANKRILLSKQTNDVLEEFSAEMRKEIIEQICQRMPAYFNRISTKLRIEKIEIADDDFAIEMRKAGGQKIRLDELSTGEKQLYTIAVLWALKGISGAHLPVMIDSPLAPLDKSHRDNVVTDYFPHVGEQVILFSTDSEIDEEAYRKLRRSVSKSYILDHMKEEGYSTIKQGYFW